MQYLWVSIIKNAERCLSWNVINITHNPVHRVHFKASRCRFGGQMYSWYIWFHLISGEVKMTVALAHWHIHHGPFWLPLRCAESGTTRLMKQAERGDAGPAAVDWEGNEWGTRGGGGRGGWAMMMRAEIAAHRRARANNQSRTCFHTIRCY